MCVVKMGPQQANERASDCRFKVGGKVKNKKEKKRYVAKKKRIATKKIFV